MTEDLPDLSKPYLNFNSAIMIPEQTLYLRFIAVYASWWLGEEKDKRSTNDSNSS